MAEIELDRIYNEDCLAGMKRIPDGSIDLVVTDAPYWHKKSPGPPYSQRRQCNTDSKFSNSALYNYEGEMIKQMSDFDDKCIILRYTSSCCVTSTKNRPYEKNTLADSPIHAFVAAVSACQTHRQRPSPAQCTGFSPHQRHSFYPIRHPARFHGRRSR